jgi:hypothetical protein
LRLNRYPHNGQGLRGEEMGEEAKRVKGHLLELQLQQARRRREREETALRHLRLLRTLFQNRLLRQKSPAVKVGVEITICLSVTGVVSHMRPCKGFYR